MKRFPVRPESRFHIATASDSDDGFGNVAPSRSSRESQPSTRKPDSPRATADALRSARTSTATSVVRPSALSSTPLTDTTGSIPAWRSTRSLASEPEARMSFGVLTAASSLLRPHCCELSRMRAARSEIAPLARGALVSTSINSPSRSRGNGSLSLQRLVTSSVWCSGK